VNWSQYQEEAAKFFRSLNLEAATNVTLKGVRTTHDVDVLVTSNHAGFNITWIVECKHWASPVSKLHVLALREIVSDTGADRGILLAENGFQSGAIEAAALTNVQVTSLADLTVSANKDILAMRLRDLYDRTMRCKQAYWDIPKSARIEHGLRPDVSQVGYSGDWVMRTAEDLIVKGLRGTYPVQPDEIHITIAPVIVSETLPASIASAAELIAIVDKIVTELEAKIAAYQAQVGAAKT
jgi:restriction system protein